MATATSGQVYVANGAGTGVWSTLTNAFSNSRLHVQYQVSQNTADAAIPANAWTTRNLNTVVTNDISAVLGTNQLTLASGTYFCMIRVPQSYSVVNSGTLIGQSRLFNITSSAASIIGNANRMVWNVSSGSISYNLDSWITGMFTAAGSQVFAVQSFQNTALAPQAGNIATEVYTDVNIWKIS